MIAPYYQDDAVTLYHGDCLELADLWTVADVIVTDPPYGETDLSWDRWPGELIFNTMAEGTASPMWCFGSFRMFAENWRDFSRWRMGQDLVWAKPRGTSFHRDRFARSHEMIMHFYRGRWADLYLAPPSVDYFGPPKDKASHAAAAYADGERVRGALGRTRSEYVETGKRVAPSVMHGRAGQNVNLLHPTQKPLGVIEPLVRYSCPPGGTVADPFAGSGSTLVAAKALGRKAIGVELEERYCEIAARRLAQDVLDFGESA